MLLAYFLSGRGDTILYHTKLYYKCQPIFQQVTCTVLATGRRKTIPVVVTISDINDNAPKFLGTPYQVTVPEVSITYLQYSRHRSKSYG